MAEHARVIPIDRARPGPDPGAGSAHRDPSARSRRTGESGASGTGPAADPDSTADQAGASDQPTVDERSGVDEQTWEERGRAFAGAALRFARRRLTGDYDVDDFGFDAHLTDELLVPLVRPLFHDWFRTQVRGAELLPPGGALLVANHSGTLPLDGAMTQIAVHEATAGERHLRMLGADLVFRTPILSALARASGTTLACSEDVERLLGDGELVMVFPEGFKGIGKSFRDRYKLQRFGRGGFVTAALRAGVPLVPCAIVGAEEAYPMLANLEPIARLLGLPYVPVTPTFPWLGPLGLVPLPSRWLIAFGEPIRTDRYAHEPEAADDPTLVLDLTEQVRETIQRMLHELLLDRPDAFG